MKEHQKSNSEVAKNIQALQRQKLQEIGANLFSVRTEKGLELDTIVSKTQITKRILIAIEQGHLEDLPESFYTKALIQKYAKALGILDIPDYTVVDPDRGNSAGNPFQKLHLGKYLSRWQLPQWRLRSQHLYLVYLILVGIAVKGITVIVDNPNNLKEPILFTETDISQTTSTSVTNSAPNNKTSSQLVTQSNQQIADSVVVDVSVKDRCWLKVIVDGQVDFEGILLKGTTRSWTGQEKITIVAGNAGGVVVTYNKGQGKILGEPGEREEVTYTVN